MATRYVAMLEGATHDMEVEEIAANKLRLKLGSNQFEIDVEPVDGSSFSVLVGHRAFDLGVVHEGEELLVSARGSLTRVTLTDTARRARRASGSRPQAAGRAELKAMMPGRVVNLLIKEGDEVAFQQGVVVVEAMKMENELKSPKAGKVVEVKVKPGQTVEKGELLVVIE